MERKEAKECMARKGNCLQDRKNFLSNIFKNLRMDSLMERPSLMLVVLSAVYSKHFILNFRTTTTKKTSGICQSQLLPRAGPSLTSG